MAVKIFGHTVSTPAAVAIAGGSGLAIWFAYKQHKDSAAAGSATSPTAIDPVTGLPYSQDQQIDPLTGLAYLAEAQEYGSVSAAEQAVAGESSLDYSSAGGSGYGSTGSTAGSSGGSTVTDVPPSSYTTNAQWAAAVQAGLVTLGYSATDVAAALGAYLGSLPETAAQAGIVDTALAEYGPPPSGSYTVILSGTGSTGSGSTGSGTSNGNPTGPVTGTPKGTFQLPSGHSDTPYSTYVDLGWSAVPGAHLYHYQVLTAAGASVSDQGTTATSARVSGLKSKTAYKWRLAVDATSTMNSSPWSAEFPFTTT